MTDLGCSCVCVDNYDAAKISSTKMVKARKEYTCYECDEPIEKGELHEYTSGLWEGGWESFRTCTTCVSIRTDLCGCGWIYGELREMVWEYLGVDYVTGRTCDDEEEDDEEEESTDTHGDTTAP